LLAAAIDSREHQIDDVRQALGTHADAVRDRQRAEDDVQAAVDAEGSAVVDVAEAGLAYDAALGEQERRLVTWADQLTEIRVDRADLLGAVASEPAVGEIVGTAVSRAREGIAGQETSARTVRDEHNRVRTEVEAELALRRARTELVPDPPATRTADREAMAGAPLWRLVRFADGLDEPTQAGIEAALHASGLLDAWVTPTGAVLLDGGHDIFAIAAATPAETGGGVSGLAPGPGTLGEVLVAEPDLPVGADVIARLLSSVGYGLQLPSAGTAAISADGRWRLAQLTGSWSVSQAAHIGATARERARLARIAALEAQLAQIEAEIAAVDAELDALTQRRRTVAAEQQARPDYHALNAADARYRESETRLAAAKERVSAQRGRLAGAEAAVAAALRRLSTVAASNGLPAEEQALSRLSRTLGELRTAGDRWLDALSELRHAQARSDMLTDVARRAVEAATEEEASATEAQAHARRLQVQLEAVEGSVSAPYLELLAEIDRERAAHGDAQRSAAALQRSVADLADRIGELRERRRADAEKRDEALAVRDSAAGRFRQLAGSVLIEDAGAEVVLTGTDGVRATLDAARNLAAVWSGVPYERKNVADAGARLTEAVHQVRELLAERAELEIDTDDDVHLVTAGIDGARLSVAALLDRLRADRDRGQADISAAERDLFDKTLTGDTRRHLAARIRQAGELVDRMNHNLMQVRTASNISVKLTWQVDKSLPSGTAAARDLLLKDPVRLRDEDRDALHVFFRERIDEARAANTAASWEQQLAEVFDYTAWHQFLVRIDRRDGNGWQELTKRLHGALSGGEKAIALHLPLFAAVCAYYESVPEAPRLIMLDEVFVGVDTPNRGQVFGLLAALNLDLVLTSDHEWCTYLELPGIAVHQLTRGVDSDDAVTTARFVWTGAALVPDETDGPDALGPGTHSAPGRLGQLAGDPDVSGAGSLW
nr:TIGR02680 family protein [Geodermatophilaceae bacterium]